MDSSTQLSVLEFEECEMCLKPLRLSWLNLLPYGYVKFLGLVAWGASPRRKDVAPFPRPSETENEKGRVSLVAFLSLILQAPAMSCMRVSVVSRFLKCKSKWPIKINVCTTMPTVSYLGYLDIRCVD